MRNSMITLPLLFSSLLFSLGYANPHHEAAQLLNFINSPKPMSAARHARWALSRSSSPVYVGAQDGLMEADKIDSLPGQPHGVNFDQYAGYVTVDPIKGRALFYYFVEAAVDPGSKPLVLWLNGGPGCSSLGAGAMQELGPFTVNSDGKTLRTNEAAWNNVANVIFLESPAGVGFSYSNTSSDYVITGDKSTADDSYTFLINWLDRFPQYKTRDFFITGESYAGHYIPELASLILKNNAAKKNTIIQLKGIGMGNAYVDGNTNEKATLDYFWTHALIAGETYKNIQSSCNFSASFRTADCEEAIFVARNEVGNIDLYDIYAPLCRGGSNVKSTVQPDPCAGDYVAHYLNLAELQKAFHVNGHLPHSWRLCSGDQDSVVSVTSTRDSIDQLRLPIESQWKAWSSDDEVGGYVIGYKGLTLATVRGAGHMVPIYQPRRALTLFSAFLKGGF